MLANTVARNNKIFDRPRETNTMSATAPKPANAGDNSLGGKLIDDSCIVLHVDRDALAKKPKSTFY
jgi:hypothetical protein